MRVPWFSPRISLIEMAPRPAPCSGCLGRLALPCPVCHHIQTNTTGNSQWLEESSRHCPQRQTDTVALILVGARDLRTLWSHLVPHPCPENHVPKKFLVLDHVKPPVWNPSPKIEIPHPENHVLKDFRFRSWKPWVWKSRPQSWDLKS